MKGVFLFLDHPEIPSCADCQKWLHNPDWSRTERPKGTPLLRPQGSPTPCWKCPKAEAGKPNPGAELTGRNWQAFHFYLQIKAGMPMPDDAIVRDNCAAIRLVEDLVQRQRTDIHGLLRALYGGRN